MNINAILLSVGVFLAVILLLVIVLLVAKKFLVPSLVEFHCQGSFTLILELFPPSSDSHH